MLLSNIIINELANSNDVPAYVVNDINLDVVNIVYELLGVELGKVESNYSLADCNEPANEIINEISASLGTDIKNTRISENGVYLINKVANALYAAAMKERGLA